MGKSIGQVVELVFGEDTWLNPETGEVCYWRPGDIGEPPEAVYVGEVTPTQRDGSWVYRVKDWRLGATLYVRVGENGSPKVVFYGDEKVTMGGTIIDTEGWWGGNPLVEGVEVRENCVSENWKGEGRKRKAKA
ncbi:MAG: hypothetical protein ACPLXP_03530 [Microgenomates group bacterium]